MDVRVRSATPADVAEIVELVASGCHLILFTTGRGSVAGAAVAASIGPCVFVEPGVIEQLQTMTAT